MSDPAKPVRIDKQELYSPTVEQTLTRERALKKTGAPPPPEISALRRLLYNSLFYLPIAAGLGVLVAWLLVEPRFHDAVLVGGEVTLINHEPFAMERKMTALTVGNREVLVNDATLLEKGAAAQKPYKSIDDVTEGDYIEVVGVDVGENRFYGVSVRPADEAHAARMGAATPGAGKTVQLLYFPIVAAMIALGLLLSDGLSHRNWTRVAERTLIGTLLGTGFAAVSSIMPASLLMGAAQEIMSRPSEPQRLLTVHNVGAPAFLVHVVARSLAWACVGAALGLGISLVRSTKAQTRNAVLGGAIGGAFGGALFDPIDRFTRATLFDSSSTSRLLGFAILGISIGLFMALVERLAREAWLRVRTGPLAGKSFVLYRNPTRIGSSPDCDVYLFKDAEIDPAHAQIHRVGMVYELEDLGTRHGTRIGEDDVRRKRLVSGDQITIGSTVLEFEERAKR